MLWMSLSISCTPAYHTDCEPTPHGFSACGQFGFRANHIGAREGGLRGAWGGGGGLSVGVSRIATVAIALCDATLLTAAYVASGRARLALGECLLRLAEPLESIAHLILVDRAAAVHVDRIEQRAHPQLRLVAFEQAARMESSATWRAHPRLV
jgi:hypothetical protein